MAINAIQIEGAEEIREKINNLIALGKDLRPQFESIASDFYKSQRQIVFSATPGKYDDLKDSTKKQKEKKVGFVYPILVQSGRLRDSLTIRDGQDNITIIKKDYLEMGTSTPYAKYLQFGAPKRNMPARPPILISVGGRKERWLRILETAMQEAIK